MAVWRWRSHWFVVACNRSFGAAVPAGAPSTSLPAEVMVQSLSLDVLITGGVVDLSSLVGHFQYNVGGTGSMMQANVSTLFKPLSANLANDMQMLPTRVLTSPFPAKVFTLDDRKRQVALADSSPVAAAAAAAGKKLAEAGSSSPPAAKQPGVTLLGSQLHDIQALTQQPQSSPASVQPSQPSASVSGAPPSPAPPTSGEVGQKQHTSGNSRLVAIIIAGLTAVLLLM
ncbi:MAG: hypothetical protein WDW38_002352 [Sanguina aurantia]